jgi:hypothetical protein
MPPKGATATPSPLSNWNLLKMPDFEWRRCCEIICVAETYTVNSFPQLDGDPLNKNATDFKVQ